MLEVGESLGTRYKVSTTPEESRAGALFDAIDRGATVVRAQLLGELALTPNQHSDVRKAVTALPALPTLLRPRDLVLSARSLPIAIYDRPAIEVLRPKLADMTAAQGKRPMVINLLRWFAQIAADLSHAHSAGVMHGAINPHLFVVNTRNDSEPCLLTGFGMSAASRALAPDAEALTTRKDLVDLLAGLHDLFLLAGASPEGSASSKWTLLRHSAMHGEHPALANGMSLSNALNEIASLPDDADVRPARMATVAPPPRPGARSTVDGPIGPGRSTVGAGGVGRPRTVPPAPLPPPKAKPKFSWPIVIGGIVLVVGVAGAGAFYAWKVRSEVSTGQVRIVPRPVTAPPAAARCEGEPTSPINALHAEHPAADRAIACSPDGQRIVVSMRVESTLHVASRASARGSAWTDLTVAQGVVEAGSVLSVEGAEWVAWRNGVGPSIGLARVQGGAAATVEVPLQGWDVLPLRGVYVVHATARDVFVVTTVESEGGAHAVLIDVALAPLGSRPPVVAWYVGSGAAEAVIPGPEPMLLMQQRVDGGHALSVVTLHLAALARASTPSDVSSIHGATLPNAVLDRSDPVTVAGDALRVAPHGIASSKTFLVHTGPGRVSDSCRVIARCPNAGHISLVSFGAPGPAVVREVDPNAWGEDLMANEAGALEALVVGVNPRGEPLATHSLRTVTAAPAATLTTVRGIGPVGALAVRCGQDAWALFSSGASGTDLGALPLACVSEQ